MPTRDIIVIGGSAGALQALMAILGGLSSDFPATLLVVLHTSPTARSNLARVLVRKTGLRITDAVEGGPLTPGTVILARPDYHLVVEPGRVRITSGPRENRNRPAIDPLFRSAALAYGHRVIGVILSGMLDDGAAGLWSIKDRGGIAIVQSPKDSTFSMMPESALRTVEVDHVADADDISELLTGLVREPIRENGEQPVRKTLEIETAIALEASAMRAGPMAPGELSPLPGVLKRIETVEGRLEILRQFALSKEALPESWRSRPEGTETTSREAAKVIGWRKSSRTPP